MDTNKSKIIINAPEDAIYTYDDGHRAVTVFVPPYGENRLNEVIDTVYYKSGYQIPYHCAEKGAETLLILRGRVEVTLYGKICECEEGDYINIPAHCPYSLTTLTDDCLIRGIYTDVDMMSWYRDLELLSKNALACSKDKDFMSEKFAADHNYLELTAPVGVVKAEKAALPQITAKGASIYEFSGFEGVNFQLKVGRWNLKRVKEIWQYTIDKGCQIQYFKPTKNEGLFSVQSGKVRVDIGGEILFAEQNDIVHIPQYTQFAITAISEQAIIQDLNVSTRMFRMLEMLELAQRDEPEKVNDPEWMKWLFDMNDCTMTAVVSA